MSSQRKRRKSIIDEFFSGSLFDEREGFLDEGFEGGYSINVVQTPGGTKVKANVGKNTDVNVLRRRLQQQYPNAEIEIEGGKKEPLIKELSTKALKKDDEEK
jgi:hypothetical protein